MFWQKVRLCVVAYLADRYRCKAEKNRRKGLKMINNGVLLTSPRLIRRNHKATDFGYKSKYYEGEFLLLKLLLAEAVHDRKELVRQRVI